MVWFGGGAVRRANSTHNGEREGKHSARRGRANRGGGGGGKTRVHEVRGTHAGSVPRQDCSLLCGPTSYGGLELGRLIRGGGEITGKNRGCKDTKSLALVAPTKEHAEKKPNGGEKHWGESRGGEEGDDLCVFIL